MLPTHIKIEFVAGRYRWSQRGLAWQRVGELGAPSPLLALARRVAPKLVPDMPARLDGVATRWPATAETVELAEAWFDFREGVRARNELGWDHYESAAAREQELAGSRR